MDVEVRAPREEERLDAANVMRISMNFSRAFVDDRAQSLPLHDMRCAFEGDRIVATAGERRLTQRFGGRDLAMSGIWGVATLPEHRRSGLATQLVETLLRGARERGDVITALYPATMRPYRALGYEIGGTYTTHAVRLDDLPSAPAGSLDVVEYDEARDLDGIRACYRGAIAPHTGPVDSDDPWWWTGRILSHWSDERVHRVPVARGADGIEGSVSFVQDPEEQHDLFDIEFALACKHFVTATPDAYASLLRYVRGFRGLGRSLRFTGPPDEPLTVLVAEQRLRPVETTRWMLRLLDVAGALTQRGYPPVDGEAVFAVEDHRFPENAGPWRLAVEGGEATVERLEERPDHSAIGVGTLSSIFSGYLSPFDAARLGLVDADDPAVPPLARLFSGPAPFMLDFF